MAFIGNQDIQIKPKRNLWKTERKVDIWILRRKRFEQGRADIKLSGSFMSEKASTTEKKAFDYHSIGSSWA